jgi:Multiubiquitin
MSEGNNDHLRNLAGANEHLHHDLQELERLRKQEHQLEHRVEKDIDEIEKLERENRDTEIVVNGEKKTVRGRRVTYEEAIALAFPNASPGPNVSYTVTYRMAADKEKPEGSLVAGSSVRVKEGTRFNVKATDKS